jgi:hypothetical protein
MPDFAWVAPGEAPEAGARLLGDFRPGDP